MAAAAAISLGRCCLSTAPEIIPRTSVGAIAASEASLEASVTSEPSEEGRLLDHHWLAITSAPTSSVEVVQGWRRHRVHRDSCSWGHDDSAVRELNGCEPVCPVKTLRVAAARHCEDERCN